MPTTAWLAPTGLTSGQDHLGTRAICEILYGQLLPGITNVTDRARYFSLYPWLLVTLDDQNLPPDERTEWFRKADVLLTLISLAHGEDGSHTLAAVGSDTLRSALSDARKSGQPLRLSRFATRKNVADRYFKNPRGGLGQYYQGVLEGLGVIAKDAAGGVTWTHTLGRQIASAVDHAVDAERFVRCIASDTVALDDLTALQGHCLCGLVPETPEHDALVDLFWSDPARQPSLALLLHLSAELPEDNPFTVTTFRAAAATGALSDGSPWELPLALEHTRARWAAYQRSEWLSIAVQGLFWAVLTEVGFESNHPNHTALARAACEAFLPFNGVQPSTSWQELVERQLPPLHDWTHPEHEHQRAERIRRPKTEAQVAHDSLLLIAALLQRGVPDKPFTGFRVSRRHRDEYPVHLVALAKRAPSWQSLSAAEVLLDLALTWGLRLHDHIALRKLRRQLNDTFQIVHTHDGRLAVKRIPKPVFGNPRVVQARRILTDLGALADGRPTELGLRLLEQAHG